MKNIFKRAGAIALAALIALSLSVFAAAGDVEYVVVKGDTLYRISLLYDVPVDDIVSYNKLSGYNIYVGQVLKIPVKGGSGDPDPGGESPVFEDSGSEAPALNILSVSADTIDVVSFDVRNIDIRDILNIIAQASGKKIMYLGEPQTVTVTCSMVSSVKAVSRVVEAGKDLSYIAEEDVIIVGPASRLDAMFAYNEISKLITLKNIKAAEVTQVLEYLEIRVGKIEVSSRDPFELTVTATPKNMSYIADAIAKIDRAENFVKNGGLAGGSLNWRVIEVNYISFGLFTQYIELLGIPVNIIPHYGAEKKFIVAGSPEAIGDLLSVAPLFDKQGAQAEGEASVLVYRHRLTGLSPGSVKEAMAGADGFVRLFSHTGGDERSIYLIGTRKGIQEADRIINRLEQEDVAFALLATQTGAAAGANLAKIRETLVSGQAIPEKNLYIFKLPSGGDAYALYIVDNQGNVIKAKNIVK